MVVRLGLKQLLIEEYRGIVFGEARTADEAITQVVKHPWDLIVVDVIIAGNDGFKLLQELLQRSPGTRVLVFSTNSESQFAARARQLGASGYLWKTAGRSETVKAFKSIFAGRPYFKGLVKSTAKPTPEGTNLSAREYKVLMAFTAGRRPTEIAADLNLSIKTVSTYKRRILNKLHLGTTADLVRYVIDHGLS